MAGRRRRKSAEDRRAEILKSAFNCFLRRGFHKTTIDDIASHAGLAKGTVYWYFRDKQDVFISFYLGWAEEYLKGLVLILSGAGSTREKVFRLGSYMVSRAESQPEMNRALHDLWLQAMDHPRTYKLFMEFHRRTIDRLETLVREGIGSKQLRQDMNPRLAAFMVATVMDNLDHMHLMGFEDIDPSDYWRQASRVLFEGMAPDGKGRAER